MQCTVQWEGKDAQGNDGMAFTAHTETGHTLRMDGAPASAPGEPGGHNLAPRPMETVLAGTGGCTAYDVVYILKKARQDVRGCEVRLDAERAATDPKVFTRIHMHFVVTGVNLREDMVRRAVELSHTKYCSASAMLEKTATMTFSVELAQE
ncbi:MAG: OsmC family protein [Thiomonas sp.]|jgi:putative redox protein|uniref:OsmC family protein n=1 Tax=Thiomonas sp. TaxID=2047785 RepID=UPI0023A5FB22|nr:OsmC family protein [Thiomonas sp.]MDE2269613.1 OsmC family protein [Betaproteobacteria bacterium]